VCAGIVLAGTDFGAAPRRLTALLAGLSAENREQIRRRMTLAESALSDMQPVRRELVRQVIALDSMIDQAIGESSRLHYHLQVLQTAMDGLFEAWPVGRPWFGGSRACRMTRLGRKPMPC